MLLGPVSQKNLKSDRNASVYRNLMIFCETAPCFLYVQVKLLHNNYLYFETGCGVTVNNRLNEFVEQKHSYKLL